MKKREQKYEEVKTKRESMPSRLIYEEATQFLTKAIEEKFSFSKDSSTYESVVANLGLELKR